MERICRVLEILPGREAEYDRRHGEVWPDLVTEIQQAGFRNYSLFRRGTTVIAYAECHPDAATALSALSAAAVSSRWAGWFSDVLVPITDADLLRTSADEVWHLD